MTEPKDDVIWSKSIRKAVEGQRCSRCEKELGLANVEAVGLRRLKSPDKTQSVPLEFTILICPNCNKTKWIEIQADRGEWLATSMLAWNHYFNYKPGDPVILEA